MNRKDNDRNCLIVYIPTELVFIKDLNLHDRVPYDYIYQRLLNPNIRVVTVIDDFTLRPGFYLVLHHRDYGQVDENQRIDGLIG